MSCPSPIAPAHERACVCHADSTVTRATSMLASIFQRSALISKCLANDWLCQAGICGLIFCNTREYARTAAGLPAAGGCAANAGDALSAIKARNSPAANGAKKRRIGQQDTPLPRGDLVENSRTQRP